MKRVLFLGTVLILSSVYAAADFPSQQRLQQRIYNGAVVSRPEVYFTELDSVFLPAQQEYRDFLFKQAKEIMGPEEEVSLTSLPLRDYLGDSFAALKQFDQAQKTLSAIAALRQPTDIVSMPELLTILVFLDAELIDVNGKQKFAFDARPSVGPMGGLAQARASEYQSVYSAFSKLAEERKIKAAVRRATEKLKNVHVFSVDGEFSTTEAVRAIGIIYGVPSPKERLALLTQVFGDDADIVMDALGAFRMKLGDILIVVDLGQIGEQFLIGIQRPNQPLAVFDRAGRELQNTRTESSRRYDSEEYDETLW